MSHAHNVKQTSPRIGHGKLSNHGPGAKQKNQSAHKKSNSLANSKITDIINGLHLSLGVINQNMKSAQSQDEQERLLGKILAEQSPE